MKRKRKKKMKKVVKKLMKSLSNEEDKKEKVQNRLELKLTKHYPEESDDVIGTARKVKIEDKETKNAENTQEAMEIKKRMKEYGGRTSRDKKNERVKSIDPFWWKGGKTKQKDRINVNAQNNLVAVIRNMREKNNERNKRKRKRRKGTKRHSKKVFNEFEGPGKGKSMPKVRKIESPTHIIIKERMNYVEGKGWKVNILKIKKSKNMYSQRTKVKKYTIVCDKNQSNCKIYRKQTRNKLRMAGRKAIGNS